MAHIKKLNFLKNHKELVDENYSMVAVPTFSDTMDKDLSQLFKSQNKTGKVGELVFEIDNDSTIVYYALGNSKDKTPENFRRAAGEIVGYALKHKYNDIAVESPVTGEGDYFCQAFAEGLILSSYRFLDYFTDERGKYHLNSITVVGCSNEKAAKKGAIIGSAVCDSRDLGNHPGNITTPTRLAEFASEVGKKGNMKVTIFDREEFTEMGMGSFAGVAQGTNEPPKFIIMEYNGGKNDEKPIMLVGKGLTFDTGGVSLKPGLNMDQMKFDMCGSAVVFGIMNAIAELKPKVNVVAIVPSTHNMLGGSAYRPGDILTAYNGKTIEVLNTDAEGRLILADALAYASKHYDPEYMLDFATLTGAVVITLGHIATGLMSNNESLVENIKVSSDNTGEHVWQLPLWDEYCDQVKSEVADVKNLGSPGQAGTIAGAAFLKAFVGKDIPWAHFDVAGTSYHVENRSYIQKNSASGQVIRLVLDLIGA
ncbi:MAG: leucyl aminopeptidase [Rickettsiales bacterium TMED289]|nr:MAG: leucyl aminopeptidase [Rickettsiales bacterium TMED289]|tara:strand:- start:204 stop:1643 length:1440 start_codon:yes stop_codon:yes gene_type:complete